MQAIQGTGRADGVGRRTDSGNRREGTQEADSGSENRSDVPSIKRVRKPHGGALVWLFTGVPE
jgi:hypothetical protein